MHQQIQVLHMQIGQVVYFLAEKVTVIQAVVAEVTTAEAVADLVVKVHQLLLLTQVAVVVHLIMDIHKSHQVQQKMEEVSLVVVQHNQDMLQEQMRHFLHLMVLLYQEKMGLY
jgi:hypothetical protein